MKTFKEWKRPVKTITVTCHDQDNTLEKLLECIKRTGNCGHTFTIIVDPPKGNEKFEWDGDGSDSIVDIKVS